jgi:hypothetical protein
MGEQQFGQLKGGECFKNDKSTHIRRKITETGNILWCRFCHYAVCGKGREGGYHQAINL